MNVIFPVPISFGCHSGGLLEHHSKVRRSIYAAMLGNKVCRTGGAIEEGLGDKYAQVKQEFRDC